MVGSASPVVSLVTYGSPWTIFIRQVLWMVVGTGALLVFARIDYRTLAQAGRAAGGRSPSACCWPCSSPASG